MIEIPESRNLSLQADELLTGKTVAKVINATSPHKFTWYYGDPETYDELLKGKSIVGARGHGMYVDLLCENDIAISIGDGTNLRYYNAAIPHPKKHQMLIEFTDGSFVAFTVAMYGVICACKGEYDNVYHQGSLRSLSPLSDEFNRQYFESIFKNVPKNISVKALLATEQRIPGFGNGVLQDILFLAGIHPKRKKDSLSDFEKNELFYSLKTTLNSMTDKGGRNTEKNLLGNNGGYVTVLSKNTYKDPCPNCGNTIVKEAYLGGSVYYCSVCQRLNG